MNGPCLCGDSLCPHCGDPSAEAIENAQADLVNAMGDAAEVEYAFVTRAIPDLLDAFRRAHWPAVQEAMSLVRVSTQEDLELAMGHLQEANALVASLCHPPWEGRRQASPENPLDTSRDADVTFHPPGDAVGSPAIPEQEAVARFLGKK